MTDTSSTPSSNELILELADPRCADLLAGKNGRNLQSLERALPVKVHLRSGRMSLSGQKKSDVAFAANLLSQLYELLEHGYRLEGGDFERAQQMLHRGPDLRLKDLFLDSILKTDRGRSIAPKGPAQKAYIDAIRSFDIVFGVGPAGTGKTYLAMAMAIEAFLAKRVRRIILTRPAVEAGEKLGFLPGNLAEKVNPYLRPLKDALNDMMAHERVEQLLETGVIEVAPLAFMRGRTLNDCFVILDEAQNATREQMKMFLTRLGFDTKTVITGDITQVDLPDGRRSGLRHALNLLDGIDGIAICSFTDVDVVRHPLVMKVIRAYDRAERREASDLGAPGSGHGQ